VSSIFQKYITQVGLEIKSNRISQNLTQLDLAIKADMEENAIQRIEKGRTNPTTKTLIRIAIALNLEVADLFPKFID
jgi:transcriptional regulator with XRE-family HTH domain|tara:strand:+ start:16239 stop:16469 length:231 start_codon:yes stop_codon:yes gene_type:complete